MRWMTATSRPLTLAAWWVLLLGAGSGLASAAIPGADGQIAACYTVRSGAVRIVDASVACSKTEARLTWPSDAVRSVAISDDGHLRSTDTSGLTSDLGIVPAVRDATIDADRHLVITYADATTRDLGNIQGPPGPPLGSLDALAGLPCKDGAGVTVVTYGSGAEAPVSVTCRLAAMATLTVRVWTGTGPTAYTRVVITPSSGSGGSCGGDSVTTECTYDLARGTEVRAEVWSAFPIWTWGGTCAGTPTGDPCVFRLDGPTTIVVEGA